MHYRPSWLRKIKYGLGLLAAWVLVHTLVITWDGLRDDQQRADLGVVLGNKVNEDGTLSQRLTQRLACGLALYRSGYVRQLLVSGGLGKEGFYEGTKMRDYLRAHGVPDSVIIVDNAGNTTQQTVRNTTRLRAAQPIRSVLVVSQFYHISRTKLLFRQAGFTAVSGASPAYFEWRDIYSLLREFVAYYHALLLPQAD
ncbi:YdcF family protein [Hymenobacter sp. BT559]|uniref:YdcF family protein n=1 Tax=Hymenobacter sp. BT559 TaxID=2795729 RepID=UPI0018EA8FE2|nr:YdcF family protein [Hymenobacter sp. BT559]MBJ6146262.1 YdcF family protein [Hymenobacter sp. BT559]